MFAITKMIAFKKVLFLTFTCLAIAGYAQENHRFKAGVTIKEKKPDGTFNLTRGTLYYDINTRKAVYDITFPEKAVVIITDTAYISIQNGERSSSKSAKEFLDFSLFNLCLTGKLDYYGLKGSPYTISKTEKEDSMIITTWSPPSALKKKKGVIKVSNVNKKLFGVIIYDEKGTVLTKQFFENYVTVKNLLVPSRVVSFFFLGKVKSTQITEFKNIEINEAGNDSMYDHALE
ncbi:MAG: hypothetical protein ACKVQB_04285 [Bacteroidia bacterium]